MMRLAVMRRETGGGLTKLKPYLNYRVDDPRGKKIEHLKEAYFFNMLDEPEYLEVRIGFFGLRTALIPVVNLVMDNKRQALTLQ
jgi:hypothetical protein